MSIEVGKDDLTTEDRAGDQPAIVTRDDVDALLGCMESCAQSLEQIVKAFEFVMTAVKK